MSKDFLDKFVHEKGRRFYPAKLPSDIERGQTGDCFDHCLVVAAKSFGKYRYCEGKAFINGKWIHHAWLTDAESARAGFVQYAYDPTWKAFKDNGEEVAVPAHYIGAALDLNTVIDFVVKTEFKSPFANFKKNPELAQKVYDAAH